MIPDSTSSILHLQLYVENFPSSDSYGTCPVRRVSLILVLYSDGQYLTFCDKVGGSFRAPIPSDDPLIAALAAIELNKLKDPIGALGLEEEKEKLID